MKGVSLRKKRFKHRLNINEENSDMV
jgi:hypothetical protein